MLRDNPLLTLLGRRGAGAVVEALTSRAEAWSLRALARAADVPAMTAARIVRDLEAVGAVDILRPGRDAQIRWRSGPAGDALAALDLPDLRRAALDVFTGAYAGPGRVVRWEAPGDHASGVATPTRIAVLSADDAAWDALDDALDAVRRARLPAPDVTVHDPAGLDEADPVAAAVSAASRAGN